MQIQLCCANIILVEPFNLEIQLKEEEKKYLFKIIYIEENKNESELFCSDYISEKRKKVCKIIRKTFIDLINWSKCQPIEGDTWVQLPTAHPATLQIQLNEQVVFKIYNELKKTDILVTKKIFHK